MTGFIHRAWIDMLFEFVVVEVKRRADCHGCPWCG